MRDKFLEAAQRFQRQLSESVIDDLANHHDTVFQSIAQSPAFSDHKMFHAKNGHTQDTKDGPTFTSYLRSSGSGGFGQPKTDLKVQTRNKPGTKGLAQPITTVEPC